MKDLSGYGGMPQQDALGCCLCGGRVGIRKVGVVTGEGDFVLDFVYKEVCAKCASRTTVLSIVSIMDAEKEPDIYPDYPGDIK